MEMNDSIQIAADLCTGCGSCIYVCPFKNIDMVDGKAALTGEHCISCGHCAAVCTEAAIQVPAIDDGMGDYKTFNADKNWLPYGQYDTAGLVRLMGSRRSCRNFLDRSVDRSMLEDLVKIGITAPSGTNSQLWTFTIVPTRKAVVAFAGHIASYFRKLNSMAEKASLRTVLKLVGKGELDEYYRSYYPLVKQAIDEWDDSGKDRLFHGAASAIIVSMKPGASCPAEDALLATQNILLASHSIGLGSCLIGFAVSAIKQAPEIKLSTGIPSDETVYAVIALGYPNESYRTVAGRKKAEIRDFAG
ncbi:MAG TPA: nitroreductase family protein [Dissulfurispiraceae bacterium]|nr:nitroreductase family protein [Dissulfurispiraceae bacterium]